LLFPSFLLGLAGKNYVVEPAALGLMVSGHLVYGYFGLSGQVLLGMGLSKWQFYQSLLALGLSAVLNLYWIPLYGLRGAAMASLTVLSLQALMQWFVARHLLGLKLMGTKLIPVGILCFALVIYSIYK
jgi:O-antigen/teichoic acid export membrane protein